ncbi:putative zinc finger, CCHC-type containing protein [Tanacetum coccineum]
MLSYMVSLMKTFICNLQLVTTGQVCKLRKFLHGPKQTSRQWNHELSIFLQALGFTQSKNDYSLFVKKHQHEFTAVLVYVDDILITGNCEAELSSTKMALDQKFTIKDLGLAQYFLGIEICRTAQVLIPIKGSKGNSLSNPEAYRRLVGRLLYLTMTRPDISYVVQHLSQFVSAPTDLHMQAGHHLLRYLEGSVGKGLFYPVQPHLHITGFSDADCATCLMTRRSLTSYCIFLGHSLVSWKITEGI